ncbi:MAG: DUF2341 domain-containing protein [Cyanobacteria bacterium J06638_22]
MLTTQPDHVITTRNTSLVINVLKNDSGVDVGIVGTSSPGYGSLSINSNQTITYTPPNDFIGLDSFSYTVRDGANDTGMAIVTVKVIENEAPVAVDDVVRVTTGEEILIPALANDNDPDLGDNIALIASTAPSFGSISLGQDAGTFRYRATSGYVGLDSFVYTIRDSFGQIAKGKVTITVEAPNAAPVLKPRRFETFEGLPLEIDLLGCATDPDDDPLLLYRVGRPGHGSISITNGQRGFYTPAPDYVGLDSFVYVVRDTKGATTSGVIEIHVKDHNKRPTAANDNIETTSNSPININILANDFDHDNDTLAISSVILPMNGSVAVNIDNTITYTPALGYVGQDSFSYAVTDGKSEPVQAHVSVNVTLPDLNTFANGYINRRRFVVAADRVVGDGSLQDFPLFVHEQADWLKNTAHGGKIEHDQGYDMRFELPNGMQLDHELENYDPETGTLTAWVRLPSLEATSNTEFFLYYGRPDLSASEEWAVGVWQNYLAVIDCETGADRSGNSRDAFAHNVEPATLLGSAGRYNGTDSKLEVPTSNWLDNLDALTAQVVFKSDVTGFDQTILRAGSSGTEAEASLAFHYDGDPDNAILGRLGTTDGSTSAKTISNVHTTETYWAALTWSRDHSVTIYGQGVPLELSDAAIGSAGLTQISSVQGADPTPLLIGSGSANWQGIIDEVRFCADELTSDWLATEYSNQRDPRVFYGIGGEEQVDNNTAPVALPDTALTSKDTSIDLDVLANDLGNSLSIIATSTPASGTAVDIGDGSGPIRYTPASDFAGKDHITYTITDSGGRLSQGMVRIEVEAPPPPPPPPTPPSMPLAPSGSIDSTPIVFSWTPTESATEYLMRVRNAGTEETAHAARRSAIDLGCQSGTCSIAVNELDAGDYEWEVRPFIGDNRLDYTTSLPFTLDRGTTTQDPDDDLPPIPDPERTINVTNISQLDAAIANANPGDHIILANGTYDGEQRDLDIQGSVEAPIVLKAATTGQAVISNGFSLQKSSQYVTLLGLTFNPGKVTARGNNNRISRCYFETELPIGTNRTALTIRESNNLIVDYCDFTVQERPFGSADNNQKYNSIGMPFNDRDAQGNETGVNAPHNTLFYGCYFHDYPAQLKYSQPYFSAVDHCNDVKQAKIDIQTVWRRCLFKDVNIGNKLWETKSAGVTIEFSTFLNCNAYNAFRQGGGCVALGNWMENCKGWRAHRQNCQFYYNKFINSKIQVMAGQVSHTSYVNAYPNAYNTLLVGNDGPLIIGETFGGETFPALNTLVEGHAGQISYGDHSNTQVRAEITLPELRVTPIKLGVADVGPLANLT